MVASTNATFAITGGTGTLGHALIRTLLAAGASRVVSISRNESNAARLTARYPNAQYPALRVFLGDVRDSKHLAQHFRGCDTVIHTAALKRVDQGVYNSREMVSINIDGTINVIDAAAAAGVKRVLVISSDKAVAPSNLYGVTKMAAEHIAVYSNTYTWPQGTRVSVVRYGNVLGSRGSVLPAWRRALRAGLPVSVTDFDMTRFLLTLPGAVALVLSALELMDGGEVFVPILPATTLRTFLDAVVRAEQQQRAIDHHWTVDGLRPGGEKHHESLLTAGECLRAYIVTGHSTLVRIEPSVRSWTTTPYDAAPNPIPAPMLCSDSAPSLTLAHLAHLITQVPEEEDL